MYEIRDATSNDFLSPSYSVIRYGSALTGGGRTERYLGRTKGQMLTLSLKKSRRFRDLQTGGLACIYYGLK
jgi:hypothetical protein